MEGKRLFRKSENSLFRQEVNVTERHVKEARLTQTHEILGKQAAMSSKEIMGTTMETINDSVDWGKKRKEGQSNYREKNMGLRS
jgi:hypothetical protein